MTSIYTNAAANEPAVAIIGFGTAGVNTLIGLRSAGYTGPVRVFSNTDILPYSPILTSYYAGGRKTREQCFPWTAEEIESLGADVLQNCPVEHMDLEAHTITTPLGVFLYTKCVIATGARPMAYGFPTDCGYEPLMLRTMDHAERLRAALADPATERVLISGASMVALKALEACLEQGKRVTLVGMNPHVLDFNALPKTAERIEDILRDEYDVELRLGMVIKGVERKDNGQLEVTFSNGDTDVFDQVFVAHGMRSNLEFLPEGSVDIDRAVLVDEFMHTSAPDLFAAGDTAQALELVSGERRMVGIWKTAARMGAVAGATIAAELAGETPQRSIAYTGAVAMNTITIQDALFISAGFICDDETHHVEYTEEGPMLVARIWEHCTDGAGIEDDENAEAAGTERLVGFNLSCRESETGSDAFDTGAMLTMLIEQGFRRTRAAAQ